MVEIIQGAYAFLGTPLNIGGFEFSLLNVYIFAFIACICGFGLGKIFR